VIWDMPDVAFSFPKFAETLEDNGPTKAGSLASPDTSSSRAAAFVEISAFAFWARRASRAARAAAGSVSARKLT
jgi:hypothetical protein